MEKRPRGKHTKKGYSRLKRKVSRRGSGVDLPRIPVMAVLVLIFLFGAIFGGGVFSWFSRNQSFAFKEPYYSPDVFLPPREVQVLGQSDKTYRIPILLYHYVEFNKDPRDTIRISLTIYRNIFEKQVQDLLAAGYTFLTAGDVGQIIDGEKQMPEKPVVLTFDDGYRDFYTDVFPILQFYNIKATIFVVSDFLNHSNNLTDEQLKEIIQSRLVEVGGHTFGHLSLTGLSSFSASKQITDDKAYLEKTFGIRLVSFAYPYGEFNAEVADLVKAAGYHQGVSVVRGAQQSLGNRFFLYRLNPGRATGDQLLSILSHPE